jgi:uncharacterized protein (TIGR00730 family)
MHRICIFAGSKLGRRQEYYQTAYSLGKELVSRGFELVYGGANVGLMGIVADAVLAEGGQVIGVVPKKLFEHEGPHSSLTHLYEVESMHERKALMADLSDGFIALPGGVGTFEELLEITTWSYIQLHSKPIGVLNIAGFFSPLLELLQHSITEEFMPVSFNKLLLCKDNPSDLLDAMTDYSNEVDILPNHSTVQ